MSPGKRLFAWMYHTFLSDTGRPNPEDAFTREVRAPLLAQARGKVLEIGAGDGGNLSLYPNGVRLTLLDINPYMLRYLRETAEQMGIEGYRLIQARAERLPFSDGAFDTVVSTHVLCSVESQPGALAEIRRVLRPGGRFLFLEHVAAPPATFTYRVQHLINPAWRAVGDGCHLTRNTGDAIRAAGFHEVEIIPLSVEAPAIVSPHILGSAIA